MLEPEGVKKFADSVRELLGGGVATRDQVVAAWPSAWQRLELLSVTEHCGVCSLRPCPRELPVPRATNPAWEERMWDQEHFMVTPRYRSKSYSRRSQDEEARSRLDMASGDGSSSRFGVTNAFFTRARERGRSKGHATSAASRARGVIGGRLRARAQDLSAG